MDEIDPAIRAAALADTFKALSRMDRVPFRKVLADLLECAPTPENIRALAEKSPDRWAQALSIVAGLAGFDRGIGPTINLYNVGNMSDAQLMERLSELDRQRALPSEKPIEFLTEAPQLSAAVNVDTSDQVPTPAVQESPVSTNREQGAGVNDT